MLRLHVAGGVHEHFGNIEGRDIETKTLGNRVSFRIDGRAAELALDGRCPMRLQVLQILLVDVVRGNSDRARASVDVTDRPIVENRCLLITMDSHAPPERRAHALRKITYKLKVSLLELWIGPAPRGC